MQLCGYHLDALRKNLVRIANQLGPKRKINLVVKVC
jgi:hypothetical protein